MEHHPVTDQKDLGQRVSSGKGDLHSCLFSNSALQGGQGKEMERNLRVFSCRLEAVSESPSAPSRGPVTDRKSGARGKGLEKSLSTFEYVLTRLV